MAVYGIISEFNPFHNGHKYLIEKAKTGGNAVICVMSGNYVQRGDTAVFDKFYRAAAACANGADLVIELPTPYAMSEASVFANGACSLLKSTGVVDRLIFGSECGDVNTLEKCAEAVTDKRINEKLKQLLSDGMTYAAALTKAVREYFGDTAGILTEPNNILAVEYINACKALGFEVGFETVKRTAGHNTKDANGVFASASLIRELIKNGDTENAAKYLPETHYFDLNEYSNVEIASRAILGILRTRTADDFAVLPDLSEGIENRLKKNIPTAKSISELADAVKTKRYTLSRVRRLILNAFLNTDAAFSKMPPPYIRVLAFGEKGEELIREIKKKTALPVVVTAAEAKRLTGDARRLFDFESAATDLYGLTYKVPRECGKEYTEKIFKRSDKND